MSDESLMEFPCDFPLKVMGRQSDQFRAEVLRIVEAHTGPLDPASVRSRPSRDDTFVSITCTVRVDSREQLDALYTELSGHELVMMVL